MLKEVRRRASKFFDKGELKYIEDFFDTSIKEIPISTTTSKEWEKEFSPLLEACNLDHNNDSRDVKSFIETKVKHKNNYENELESRRRYKEKRAVGYRAVMSDLSSGINRSKKNRVRDKAEKEALNRELDAKWPVAFYLKDEWREFIIGLIVLGEAILFYSTSSLIFNNNPEVNLMITGSLAGSSILLIMLLANEMGNMSLRNDFSAFTLQEKLTFVGIVTILSCYVWFRISTKHVIEFASDIGAVEWAGTIMIALTPFFISLVAYKLEFYAQVSENLNRRRDFIQQAEYQKCQRVKDAYPTVEEFENLEHEHFQTITDNAEKAVAQEVRFAMSCFDYMHVQQIKANPAQFYKIMNKVEK